MVDGPPFRGESLARRLERPADNIPSIGLTGEDLRNMPVAKRRTFTFSDAPDFSAFYINGKTYDPNRIDTRVRLGHVEEWTIKNAAGELHVFHLHQTSFLVKEVNGVQQDYPGLRDVINVPWQIGNKPGEVKLLIPFLNPLMVGKFVYHCHIVGHEDAGMMQNIEVVPASHQARRGCGMRSATWQPTSCPSFGARRRPRRTRHHWHGPTTRPRSAARPTCGRLLLLRWPHPESNQHTQDGDDGAGQHGAAERGIEHAGHDTFDLALDRGRKADQRRVGRRRIRQTARAPGPPAARRDRCGR